MSQGAHPHTIFIPLPNRTRSGLEADVVDDVGMIVEGWNQACSRPPLTFSLLSIALQRIDKADGVLPPCVLQTSAYHVLF